MVGGCRELDSGELKCAGRVASGRSTNAVVGGMAVEAMGRSNGTTRSRNDLFGHLV